MQIPAGIRQRFESAGDVDAVAVNILVIGDYITEIDTDTQFNALYVPGTCVLLRQCLLECHRACHGLHGTRKLHQDAVTFDPHNPPGAGGDLGPYHIA
jgi:hypothetical protein